MAKTGTKEGSRPKPITKAAREVYLTRLAQGHTHRAAADAAGHHRISFWKLGERDAEFKEAIKVAMEDGVQALEQEAMERATVGVSRPLLYKGDVVATIREVSDTLLIFLLKAKRPAVYRDRVSVDHSGAIDTTGLEGVPDAALELWERIVSGDLPIDRMEMVNRLLSAEDKDLHLEVDKILESASGLPAPRRRKRKQPQTRGVAGARAGAGSLPTPGEEGDKPPASPRIRTSEGR